jgi:hypothetical protein
MIDIAATFENRKTRLEWVKNVSALITIPLTMGGGISTLEDINLVLEFGAVIHHKWHDGLYPFCHQPLQRYIGEDWDHMTWKTLHQRTWLNLISVIILLVGLGSAALIYQRAGNNPYGASGYEGADGNIYSIMPENSKLYRHNLEVYGGKFSVIMDDFRRWLVGLTQGKSLAVIIGCTTIIIAFGFFYAANYVKQPLKFEVHKENNPDGTA